MTKEKSSFYKWELLILLWFAFFFNQADRQLFNIVLPHIKADLGLSDVQAGTISSIFILTIGICIPIAGFVAPILLGYLKPTIGLSGGLSFLSIGYLVAGCAVFVALKFFFTNDSKKAIQ
jgi:sugar phosphate permease